jgi:hypothetical protein
VTQRWRQGRDSYRPLGEPIDPSRYGVEIIEDDRTPKAFVEAHHYSGSYPAARFRVGLCRSRPFFAPELVGVAVFSVPAQQAVIPRYLPDLTPADGVELGRFVLLDDVPANGETWFLARAFRALRAALGVRGVVAYSDPFRRTNAQGDVVLPGHVGTIYQAFNGSYLGQSRARTILLDPAGRVLNERTISKIRLGERGEDYAYRQLRRLGAPSRTTGEDGAAYVERVLGCGLFRRVRHPGNHVYAWPLERGVETSERVVEFPKLDAP